MRKTDDHQQPYTVRRLDQSGSIALVLEGDSDAFGIGEG